MVLSRSYILHDKVRNTDFGTSSYQFAVQLVEGSICVQWEKCFSIVSSDFLRSDWMVDSLPLFYPRQSCLLDPISRSSCDLRLFIVRPNILQKISVLLIGRKPEILSSGTNLQTYASSLSAAMVSIAFHQITFANVLDESPDAFLKRVFLLLHSFLPKPDMTHALHVFSLQLF